MYTVVRLATISIQAIIKATNLVRETGVKEPWCGGILKSGLTEFIGESFWPPGKCQQHLSDTGTGMYLFIPIKQHTRLYGRVTSLWHTFYGT
jgi:hypothetical protein